MVGQTYCVKTTPLAPVAMWGILHSLEKILGCLMNDCQMPHSEVAVSCQFAL